MPDRRFLTDRFLRSLPPAKRPPKEVARRAFPGIVCGDCLSGLFGSHRRTVSRHTHRGAVIASRRFHSVINHRHALATTTAGLSAATDARASRHGQQRYPVGSFPFSRSRPSRADG